MVQTNWTSLGMPGGTIKVFWPQVVQNADGRLEVLLTGSDGNLWHIWQTTLAKSGAPGPHSINPPMRVWT
jgi:hypothetical protein